MSVGQRVKSIIEGKKLSQSAFGASIGTSGQNINNIENDKTKPGFDVVQTMVELYGVDAHWLLTGKAPSPVLADPGTMDPIQSFASWMSKVERDIYRIKVHTNLLEKR